MAENNTRGIESCLAPYFSRFCVPELVRMPVRNEYLISRNFGALLMGFLIRLDASAGDRACVSVRRRREAVLRGRRRRRLHRLGGSRLHDAPPGQLIGEPKRLQLE